MVFLTAPIFVNKAYFFLFPISSTQQLPHFCFKPISVIHIWKAFNVYFLNYFVGTALFSKKCIFFRWLNENKIFLTVFSGQCHWLEILPPRLEIHPPRLEIHPPLLEIHPPRLEFIHPGWKSIHPGWKSIHPGWKSNHPGWKSYNQNWPKIHKRRATQMVTFLMLPISLCESKLSDVWYMFSQASYFNI